MARVTVLWFASLREAAGRECEVVETGAATLAALYDELSAQRGLSWPRERLRVSQDAAFARWDDAVRDGAEVAFIPPVSGG